MTQEELITQCRYYKGELRSPYKEGSAAAFWNYECWWVMSSIQNLSNRDADMLFRRMTMEYEAAGLKDFNTEDNVPETLKALLYSRYKHWGEGAEQRTAEEFKKYYLEEYLK